MITSTFFGDELYGLNKIQMCLNSLIWGIFQSQLSLHK